MGYTRQVMKAQAKDLCMKDQASFITLTLFYLLATDWVVTLVQMIKANPLGEAASVFSNSVQALTQAALDSGSTVAPDLQPAYSAAFAKAREVFADRFAMVLVFLYVLLFLYSVIMNYGYFYSAMKQARGEMAEKADLFSMFYLAGRILLMEFAITAIAVAGFALCIFPGIYFYYAYYMAPYCLIDHPDDSIFRAMGRSMRMMHRHKFEMFMCDMSFLGWMMLALIITNTFANLGSTMGPTVSELLFLISNTVMSGYIIPYRQLTVTLYYDSFRTLQPEAET